MKSPNVNGHDPTAMTVPRRGRQTGGGRGNERPAHYVLSPRIITAASMIDDEDEAFERVDNMAINSFVAENGEEIEERQVEIEWCDIQIEQRMAEYKAVATAQSEAPPMVPGCVEHADEEARREPVKPARWTLRDRTNAVFALVASFLLLVTSALAVHASLVDTKAAIFIENPLLPIALAGLPISIGIAVKFVGSLFVTEPSSKRFGKVVAGLAIGFSAAWIGLFASKYGGGLSGTFDLFAEPNPVFDWAYVVSQLGTEVMAGCWLFTVLDTIAKRYTPNILVPSQVRAEHDRHEARLAAEIEPLIKRRARAQGRLNALKALGELDRDASFLALSQLRAQPKNDGLI